MASVARGDVPPLRSMVAGRLGPMDAMATMCRVTMGFIEPRMGRAFAGDETAMNEITACYRAMDAFYERVISA